MRRPELQPTHPHASRKDSEGRPVKCANKFCQTGKSASVTDPNDETLAYCAGCYNDLGIGKKPRFKR